MGLDMYLDVRVKMYPVYGLGERADTPAMTAVKRAVPGLTDCECGDLGYVTVTVEGAYWRKANAIHRWFVENCQGGVDECQETYVERDQLEELIAVCRRAKTQPDKTTEILPTRGGFFFGGVDIDEWYWQDVDSTIDQLTSLLKNSKKLEDVIEDRAYVDFYYRSSW